MLKAFAACLILLATSGLTASCGADSSGPTIAAGTARPALWRIADTDTTIYLFGTIHMLPPGATWHSAAVDEALARTKAAYFETDVEGDPDGRIALVRRLGLLPVSERLSDHLTPEQSLAVSAAAARLGYALPVLETQRPWYAAVTLADAAIRAAGYTSDNGVETDLRRTAREVGKDVRFLETMERQLTTLSSLSEPTQTAYLALTVSDLDTVATGLAGMVEAWRTGDTDTLAGLLLADDIDRLPELRDALLATRNTEWAAKLKTVLDTEPGQILVAVGAAHLLGEDSLQAQLQKLGITAQRIQ